MVIMKQKQVKGVTNHVTSFGDSMNKPKKPNFYPMHNFMKVVYYRGVYIVQSDNTKITSLQILWGGGGAYYKYYFIFYIDLYQGKNKSNIYIHPSLIVLTNTQKSVANEILKSGIDNDEHGSRHLFIENRYDAP